MPYVDLKFYCCMCYFKGISHKLFCSKMEKVEREHGCPKESRSIRVSIKFNKGLKMSGIWNLPFEFL